MPTSSYGRSEPDAEGRSNAARSLALVVALGFLAAAIGGFAVTGFRDFAGVTGERFLGFEVNPLHNVVHLLVGLAGLIALTRSARGPELYGWLLIAGYGLTFLYGLFVVNSTGGANFLSLNTADNFLHLAAVAAGLTIVALARRVAREPFAAPVGRRS